MQEDYSQLQRTRLSYQPSVPKALEKLTSTLILKESIEGTKAISEIAEQFPLTIDQPRYFIKQGSSATSRNALRVGVVLSGGQAPGGHNVISGLFDALKTLNSDSELIGFLGGPKGVLESKYILITAELLEGYRNQGGFDLVGSGRDKIETIDQLSLAEDTVRTLNLDGLVIIGGDDSNTNAACLAEYFKKIKCKTNVVGVPKTIDGDLKNSDIEISFGFDTACKVYSEIIGNLARDALSAGKYYYFVKLMGRSASHVTLECSLQTHPNITLIGEEVAANKQTLVELVNSIASLICARAKIGKNYGVILIPEGIIEFIPEINLLISELNFLLAKNVKTTDIPQQLTAKSSICFQSLPYGIQEQLLLSRDSHGNVQVSKIETERLFIEMVTRELELRNFKGNFNPQPFFCGYEGRSGLPSNFDCQYCYSLGRVAAVLIDAEVTGYICSLKNLNQEVEDWIPCGIPLTSMLTIEMRKGKLKPVIKKALVDLTGNPFAELKKNRVDWGLNDRYSYPGPIQFFGPEYLTDNITFTLSLEKE